MPYALQSVCIQRVSSFAQSGDCKKGKFGKKVKPPIAQNCLLAEVVRLGQSADEAITVKIIG